MQALFNFLCFDYEIYSQIASENLAFLYSILQIFTAVVILIPGVLASLSDKNLKNQMVFHLILTAKKILTPFATIISLYMFFILGCIFLLLFYNINLFVSKIMILLIAILILAFSLYIGLKLIYQWEKVAYRNSNKRVDN